MNKEFGTSPRDTIIANETLTGGPQAGTLTAPSLVKPSTEEALLQRAREAKEKLAAVVQDLQGQAEQARKALDRNVEATRDEIRKHPLAAVGLAAAFGLLAGLLINRRG